MLKLKVYSSDVCLFFVEFYFIFSFQRNKAHKMFWWHQKSRKITQTFIFFVCFCLFFCVYHFVVVF